jgi:hypothetical protein
MSPFSCFWSVAGRTREGGRQGHRPWVVAVFDAGRLGSGTRTDIRHDGHSSTLPACASGTLISCPQAHSKRIAIVGPFTVVVTD